MHEPKNTIDQDAELYAEVYGELINTILPAFNKAVDDLTAKNYPDVGAFMINSISGVNATVLKDAINATAKQTGMPKPKARKKVLKQVNELTNLFVRRLDETEIT